MERHYLHLESTPQKILPQRLPVPLSEYSEFLVFGYSKLWFRLVFLDDLCLGTGNKHRCRCFPNSQSLPWMKAWLRRVEKTEHCFGNLLKVTQFFSLHTYWTPSWPILCYLPTRNVGKIPFLPWVAAWNALPLVGLGWPAFSCFIADSVRSAEIGTCSIKW